MSKKRISIVILVLLLVASLVLTFASCKKKDMSLTASDAIVVYDGSPHGVEVQCSLGDESGWTISYTNKKGDAVSDPTDVGVYTATVTYSKKGYNTATATATLKITEATPVLQPSQWPTVIPNGTDGRTEVFGTPLSNDWLSVVRLEANGEGGNVPGTFSWTNGQTLSAATPTYDVTFTPDNFN